jgi:D-alanyl-D-alanine carboxypeptidase/D-alanyl-D-alanine-endopeptidase (penicillin-binding protein 4)
MKTVFGIICLLLSVTCAAQTVAVKLSATMQKLEADEQFTHAIISLYVVDSKTGKAVYAKNSQVGLAPASCQKVITSVSAFELLGKNYRYKTFIGKDPSVTGTARDAGCLFLVGNNDPTLGSDRWQLTSDSTVFKRVLATIQKNKISHFTDDLVMEDYTNVSDVLPGGWVWEDIGNYYGAGCYTINWRENKFEIQFQPGKINTQADIQTVIPFLYDVNFVNNVTRAKAGSGDNTIIYSTPFSTIISMSGTIPSQEKPFSVYGSMPNPAKVFGTELLNYLTKNKVSFGGSAYSSQERSIANMPRHKCMIYLDSILSPPVDSINYWFLKKSINLYGEAFVKTIAYEKTRVGSTDTGIAVIKNFWKERGIETASLNMIDGSGLSPANRVTTQSLVAVLQYAKNKSWFPSFYNALPEMNNIKMKG